jgi:hypothetical protein
MTSTFLPAPPNPTSIDDPGWTSFNDYLARHAIQPVRRPALEAYQHAAQGRFLCAHNLNHCLTLEGAGGRYGMYSSGDDTAEERLGSLEDFTDPDSEDFEHSKATLDEYFLQLGVRFDSQSVVYKGIGHHEFYEYLELAAATVGDVVQFHGFLSTTVCRENAERFAKAGVLLVLLRIDRINTLVPPNEPVLNAPNGQAPEQELLLDRGQQFTVKEVRSEWAIHSRSTPLRVLCLEAKLV